MTSDGSLLDAIVVGYGPVGAVAAALLGRAGLRTAVFEATTSVHHLPRAAHFDAEVMRVLEEIGVGDDVLPACAPVKGMHFVNAAGDALLRFDVSPGSGWMFYQPDLERALRAAIERLPAVEVHLAHEVTEFEQYDDHVAATVCDLEDGTTRTVTARYLLGADGARSIVRRTMGVGRDDLEFDQPWLVVDTMLRRAVELPELVQQICDPARPTTFIPMCGARRRWEFMLLPGETAADMEQPARIAELLAPWVTADDVEIVRAVVYTFHAAMAQSWRDRRAFLLGDSAHQMPPFLGQGMCSGIRDAHNLVWKLALVANGHAGDALLDTYEQERAPHVRRIVETAVALGGVLQTTDPEVAAARDAQFLASDEARPGLGEMPGLVDGIVGPGGGGRFAGDVGGGFVLVGPRTPELPADLERWWRAIGGREITGKRETWLLVRPDRYVFSAGDDGATLVSDLRSRLQDVQDGGRPVPGVDAVAPTH
jgi:3-(3-hydroxy-phenyl)propionate hydroxylase